MKKRILLFTTILAALILLVSCALPTEEPLAAEDPSALTEVETERDTPILDFSQYEYRYTNARESNWERDIVYLANTFFNKHAKLMQKEIRAGIKFEDSIYVDMRDKSVKKEFSDEIYGVLNDLPKLTDSEVICRLAKAVALLDDAHSAIRLSSIVDYGFNKVFPYRFAAFHTEDGYELRTVTVPAEQSEMLMSQLVSINGIPVEEIAKRLSVYR